MSSYKFDGGRIPRPRDVASQSRNVSSSPMSNKPARPFDPPALMSSRSQLAKPINLSSRSTRGSSVSDAEENRQIGILSRPPGLPPSLGIHPTPPPRSTTHPLPVTSYPDSHAAFVSERHVRQLPFPATSPIIDTTPQKSPVRGRPRKVLRRKAPTIGQHAMSKSETESEKPERLNVIIPATAHPVPVSMNPQSTSSQIDLSKQTVLPDDTIGMAANELPEDLSSHGPKELASLRTTVNTHNLPPPTPVFHSASSPSTRYSGSPGVWSRTSTPTSLSSYSPGIVYPVKPGSRLRQPSPSQSRLPVFSPQIQQSPSSDRRTDTRVAISPNFFQNSATTSPLMRDSSQSPVVQTSRKSGLPRRANPNDGKTPQTSNEAERYVDIPNTGRMKAAKVVGNDNAQPPTRPSREGTHQLEPEPSPVVQSSLSPGTVIGHRRRGSAGSALVGDKLQLTLNRSAATSVDSLHSRGSSRIPSRMQGSPDLPRKSPRTLKKEPKATQEPPSPTKKRFGLFNKKSKPDLNGRVPDESRPVRKGPAAGTGHEGYGRYAHRGRKGSIGSSGSTTRARSTSTTRSTPKSVSSKGSSKSRPETDLDDFLLHRLEPVVIHGGGMDGAALMRTQSEQSLGTMSSGSTSNLALSTVVTQSSGYSTDSLTTSTGSASASGGNHPGYSSYFEPSASTNPYVKSSGIPLPGRPVVPKHQTHATSDPSKESEAGQPKRQSQLFTHARSPEFKRIVEPKSHKKSPKKGLGLKWPFFQKGSDEEVPEPATFAPQLQATVSPVALCRPVAHYALVDADSDPLEDIIHNIEESPPTETENDSPAAEIPAALNIKKASESILLPSPPKLQGQFFGQSSSPKVYFTNKCPTPTERRAEDGRPTRLNSVGRIPRVVSRRERKHVPAFQSFSRPFSVAAESPSLIAPVKDETNRCDMGLRRGSPATKPPRAIFDFTQPFGDPTNKNVLDLLTGPFGNSEFLTFSPGNDSTFSSSGSDSLAAVTAVIPKPGADLNEDEVWGEFDDLIDHVLSPEPMPTTDSIATDAEEKFELATMASRALQAELNSDAKRHAVDTTSENPTVALTPASPHSSNGSIRLRRSRIVSALHSSIAPSTQPSFSDIIASYQDRDDVNTIKEETSNASMVPSDEPKSTFLISPSLNPSPSFETCRQRNTVLFDIAERDREGPTAQTNIRSGSLMTSRWLSFGRVLFSPAHNRLKGGGDQERILVIDGLGNDDWSFYCALTYPNAEVYNLNDGPAPTGPKHPAAWMPPSNHHIIYHSSLDDQFPFPRGYFTVAVLRFPAASSEAVQGNIISESKRVLRPGGYMEMSVLDLDMVNMGVRTRKAVRCLKERTYLSDANISLKPASDSIQRLLGRYGFDNLRRCMVRIPVAGMIVRTSASSSSTVSSTNPPSTLAATTATPLTNFSTASTSSVQTQSKVHGKSSSNDTDLSLGDLLSDPCPSPSNDESIRKIVAKVGRWWYTRCYEIPVLPNGDVDLSIWANKKVLRECQQRGTGFRLLIAYAQKPSEKRRTASV